jgi:CRP-like cAMP-binding protein
VPAALFRARMLKSPALAQLTLLHVRANAVQAEQGVACNAAHDVPARLSSWLLMTQDRVGAKTFPLTQDYMAVMTGVQRSTVSLAASALKKRGVIDYSRGVVNILDRAGLERHACECYGIVGSQFEGLRATVED